MGPHLTDAKLNSLLVIPGILSIFGTTCILITFYQFPKLRTYRHVELAVYVAFNDLCGAIELVLGKVPSTSPACWFQGMGSSYSFLSSVLWNSVITYQIFVIVNRGVVIENLTKFHWFCWGFPLLPVLLPLITNNYGSVQNSWCFLVDRSNSPSNSIFVWEIMSFFIWLWISVAFNLVVFSMIFFRLREMQTADSLSAYRPLYRLAFCPSISVICWSIPSFLVLFEVATSTSYTGPGVLVLEALATALPPLQGFLMSCVFFIVNESARLEWRFFCFKTGGNAVARRQLFNSRNRLSLLNNAAGVGMIQENSSFTSSSGAGTGTLSAAGGSARNTEVDTRGSTTSAKSTSTYGSEEHWISRLSSKGSSLGSERGSAAVARQTELLDDNFM